MTAQLTDMSGTLFIKLASLDCLVVFITDYVLCFKIIIGGWENFAVTTLFSVLIKEKDGF